MSADPTQQDIYDAIVTADKAGRPDDVLKLTEWLRQMNAQPTVSPERQAGKDFVRNSVAAPVAGLNSAAQGATFGFSDELGGLANAAINPFQPGQAYTQGRDYLRGVGEQFTKDYPAANLVGEVGGGLAYGGPFAAAAKWLSGGKTVGTAARLAQGSALGAGAGAVGGAGRAEDVSSIPFEAAKGAAFGAVASPVLEGLGMTGVGAYKSVTPFLTGAAARTAAQQRVAEAIARGGMTTDQAAARLGRQGFGGEAGILDTSRSTLNLADTVANLPGQAPDKIDRFLRARRATAPERLDAGLLTNDQRAAPTLDLLTKVQAQQAKPLYAAVENQVVPITPQLESLMQRPAFREAFDQAVTNAANRGEQLPLLEDLLKSGPVTGVKVKFWDDVKKGLDDVIGAKKRGLAVTTPSNANQAASTLRSSLEMKDMLTSEIDQLTGGAYKRARDAFAGPAALKNAVEDGTNVWNMTATEIKDATAKMTASERQAWEIGVNEALREKAGSPNGQTQMLNAWKDRNTREKLQAIYGDATRYHKALSTILGEGVMSRAYGISGGSQTARRQAGAEDLASGIAEDAASAATAAKTGNIMGLWAAAKKVGSRMATPEPVRNEIGNILLKRGGAARDELTQLQDMVRMYNERTANQAAMSGLLAPNFNPWAAR